MSVNDRSACDDNHVSMFCNRMHELRTQHHRIKFASNTGEFIASVEDPEWLAQHVENEQFLTGLMGRIDVQWSGILHLTNQNHENFDCMFYLKVIQNIVNICDSAIFTKPNTSVLKMVPSTRTDDWGHVCGSYNLENIEDIASVERSRILSGTLCLSFETLLKIFEKSFFASFSDEMFSDDTRRRFHEIKNNSNLIVKKDELSSLWCTREGSVDAKVSLMIHGYSLIGLVLYIVQLKLHAGHSSLRFLTWALMLAAFCPCAHCAVARAYADSEYADSIVMQIERMEIEILHNILKWDMGRPWQTLADALYAIQNMYHDCVCVSRDNGFCLCKETLSSTLCEFNDRLLCLDLRKGTHFDSTIFLLDLWNSSLRDRLQKQQDKNRVNVIVASHSTTENHVSAAHETGEDENLSRSQSTAHTRISCAINYLERLVMLQEEVTLT
jgi:hypothetical protein